MSFFVDCEEQETQYHECFNDIGIVYVFCFKPLEHIPALPELVDEMAWCGVFNYRQPPPKAL